VKQAVALSTSAAQRATARNNLGVLFKYCGRYSEGLQLLLESYESTFKSSFTMTLGATVDAELAANGSISVQGVDFTVTPSGSLGGHVEGGIGFALANGSVDARVNLIKVSVPVSAQAKWVLNTDPSICALTLSGEVKGDLTVSSGGGEVDLDATFGDCPFCYTDTETLFKWGPLASASYNLFDGVVDTQLFGLPASLCSFPITVSIVSPASGASLSSGLPITFSGSAAPNNQSLAHSSSYTWTYTPGTNASTATGSTTGANPVVTFGAPSSGSSSTWTIGLTGSVTVTSAGGTQITQTASATPITVTVTNLASGVYISQVTGQNTGPAVSDTNGVLQVGNVPGTLTISGVVAGATGALNTIFTVAQCTDGGSNGYTATCSSTGPATTLTTSSATSTTPSASWTGFDGFTYKITMTTTAGGNPFGSTTVLVWGTELQ